MLLKASQLKESQLDTTHWECHHKTLNTVQLKGKRILVKYMKVYI